MPENLSSVENTLIVRHLPGTDPESFQVVRLRDGKMSQPATVPSPFGFPVEGRPNSNLMHELQWYLETFLDYPFPPDTDHAERVLKALRDWGEHAFRTLFDDRSAGRMFDAATQDYSNLHLQISSDDPRILSWPWEALRDPELAVLAHTCQIERRLNKARDPQPLPDSLPKDSVNILLVVARPYGQQDVRFRSIARPLVELIEKEKLPAYVELLRPPTFDELRNRLRERPGFFHILHFDGHGAYSAESPGSTGYTFQGPEGKLVFETENGEPDPITAEKLSALLKECAVPGVVLNACQSAMVGGGNDDPFSSVATALLRSGMRDVVAMAYSLYVSGAQKFLPAFYRRLFEEGNMAAAVRAGRQYMWQHDKRVCVRGEFPLQDWLLPVLYQQEPFNFSFAKEARKEFVPHDSKLPEELRREKNPYGFIGRDSAILELERAMRRAPAGILIQGLGGVGKTTLVRGFLQWLDQTGGLEHEPFWFSFQEIRSAEFVFNRLGEALFGGNFPLLPMEKRIEALTKVLRESHFLIVWDNFESAAGIPGTAIEANLLASDRRLLAQFLDELRGGASKVIITSRSTGEWLTPRQRFVLPLGGLDREERWEYCNTILRELGKGVKRDQDLIELMDLLGGHPLAMRVILPRLETIGAAQVIAALRSNLSSLNLGGDEDQAKLYATLAFVQQSLPEEIRPLLVLVGMHEGFVDDDYLEEMAKQVGAAWTRSRIDTLMQALVSAGLLRDIGQATYEMHPLLTSYLRSVHIKKAESADKWARAFVEVMARIAHHLASRELHEQRGTFHIHGQNFQYALTEATRLEMLTAVGALIESLASFALHNRNFEVAARLFKRLAEHGEHSNRPETEATAYHQLGRVAEEHRDFGTAEQWYRKSLAIRKKFGDDRGAASTYHQLGRVAEEQRDFAGAERWYRQSLAISEEFGNELGAAYTYHQLGRIAEDKRDFASAEQWYRKSLAYKEKFDDEHGVAMTYHELGFIAQEQGDLAAAEQWYRKSLFVNEKVGDEHAAASTYHQLGRIAREWRDFAAAEQWYRKSLAVNEKLGDEHGAANTYHQLGVIAQEQRDFAAAEQWYRKSLAINEKLGDDHAAATTYAELGLLAEVLGELTEASQWTLKAISAFLKTKDSYLGKTALRSFLRIHQEAPPREKNVLENLWSEARLGPLPKADEAVQRSAMEILATRWWNWLTGVTEGEAPPDLPSTISISFQASRVRLRNIRAFQDTGNIDLPPSKVLIVGENAAGKSTLLRCIALASFGPELANQIERRQASYLRHNEDKGFIEVLFRLDCGVDQVIGEVCVGLEIRKGERSFRGMSPEDMSLGKNCASRVDIVRRRTQDDFGFLCAYGPLRTFADPTSLLPADDKPTLDRAASLFDPHTPVVDPDLFAKLLSGDLTNFRGAPPTGMPESTLQLMKGHIRSLLPNSGEVAKASCPEIQLHGEAIPFRDLSDGYSSLLALTGHLFCHALARSQWSNDPAKVRGIALIDEIDAHLHPAWQRRVLPDLSALFSNLQIIATTHSPMVAGSIDTRLIRVLKRDGLSVKIVETPTSIEGWRADQILTSILFDLATTRSQPIEDLFRRYADSLAEHGPEHPEVQELGPRVARALEIEGEGKVDRVTHELLDQLLLERFKDLDAESRKLVLAKAGLVAGVRK